MPGTEKETAKLCISGWGSVLGYAAFLGDTRNEKDGNGEYLFPVESVYPLQCLCLNLERYTVDNEELLKQLCGLKQGLRVIVKICVEKIENLIAILMFFAYTTVRKADVILLVWLTPKI